MDRPGDVPALSPKSTVAPRVEKEREDVIEPGDWRADPEVMPPPPRSKIDPPVNRRRNLIPPHQNPQAPGTVRPPFKERYPSKSSAQRGSLPKNVPLWFKEYDTDGDARVSLAEWKAKGDDVREFRNYDLNGDGQITVEELVRTGQFTLGVAAPPIMSGFGTQIGDTYYFELTGTTEGIVKGSELYTTDSVIAAAAVHAGVLKVGETGYVKISILPGEQEYHGSFANGVQTHDHPVYHKSFTIEAVR
jgi:hypothetical protein